MAEQLYPIEILLVEDSETDALLAREALTESKIFNNLNVVIDGEQAIDYLKRRPPYETATRPDLILLDLNLPRRDGREVLADIKSDDDLKHIPVVVLTTSEDEADVLTAYGLHANCYIVKPVNFDRFSAVIRTIHDFWFAVVTLPRGS